MTGGRRGLHRRGRSASEEHLRDLGRQMPAERPEIITALAHERSRRMLWRSVAAGAVVVVVAFLGVQLLRPVPAPVFRPTLSGAIRLPGSLPPLPFPSAGSAAVAMVGGGELGQSGTTLPVPVGGLIKVLTAYVVLEDHPISNGESGPTITVTDDTVAEYQSGVHNQESEVAVSPQETLTELQALQGLLLVGANDMATLLADWDAGGTPAFVSKMNRVARALGLRSTLVSDPNGLNPATVSSASDLVVLGEAAMAIPTFAELVGTAEATLPVAGIVYNTNFALGRVGIVGIRTGSLPASGGCFLFDARQSHGGQTLTLVGDVLGQQTSSPTTAAVRSAESIITAAFAASGPISVLGNVPIVGRIESAWGSSVPVVASSNATVVAWPGLVVSTKTHTRPLGPDVADGTRVGTISLRIGDQHVVLVVHAEGRLQGPSILWRLTRF
jgi:D-alanyl-D-alanine carboxypeptidase (penicillin-binding protein 5/6)